MVRICSGEYVFLDAQAARFLFRFFFPSYIYVGFEYLQLGRYVLVGGHPALTAGQEGRG